MWNFRRTVREIVYVVKVTTHTIEQRLDEFTVTESSELSIEDFLNQEFLESRHDPPAFYKSTAEWQEKMEKEGRVRKRKRAIEDIDGEEDQSSSNAGTPAPDSSAATPRPSTEMPPPPVPRPHPDTSRMRQVKDYLPRSFDNSEGRELVAPFDPEKIPKPAPRKSADRDVVEGLAAENPEDDNAMDGLAATYDASDDQLEGEAQDERKHRRNQEIGGVVARRGLLNRHSLLTTNGNVTRPYWNSRLTR